MFLIIIEYLYIIILLLINYKLVVYFNKIIKEDLCKI
jgi:hypothetical protein